MDNYINFVLNRPKTVLLILIAITLILGSGIFKLEFDSSVDVMMPKNDNRYIQNEKIKQIYGNIGKFIIISINSDPVLSQSFFEKMNDLCLDIAEFQYYDETRELKRIDRLNAFISEGEVHKDTFIHSFYNDLPFQRFLNRTVRSMQMDSNILSRKHLSKLKKKFEHSVKIKQSMFVDDIISVLSAQDISGEDDTLEPFDIMEKDENGKVILPGTPQDFKQLEEKLFQNPKFKNGLYALSKETGKITDFSIMVKLKNIQKDDIVGEEIWNIAESYKELSPVLQGIPIVNKFMNDYTRKDLQHFMPLVICVVMLIFYLNFRSIRGVLLPIMGLCIADIWIMGLMGHMGINITIMSVSLPSLMIAIGSSYAIHILNQYYIDFDNITIMGKKEGLKKSMTHISVTVFLAGLTTFIGFSSIQTNQVTGIREWGLFSAIGVMFTVLISTSLIPAMLMLLSHKQSYLSKKLFGSTDKTWIDPLIRLFTYLSTIHYKSVIFVISIFIVFLIVGLTKIKVETDILSYFKASDYVRTSSQFIGQKYGGAVGLSILIDSGESDGILNPEYLSTLDRISSYLVADENAHLSIGNVMAFSDIIKSMHKAMNNNKNEYYGIPQTREEILDYMEIFAGDDENSDGRIDDFEPFVDPDFRTCMIFAKLYEKNNDIIGTRQVEDIQAAIEKYLDTTLPDGYRYTISGEPTLIVALSDYVISGQLSSLLFCLVAVGIIIILLFKNWKAGFIALIPMSFAVIVNFGIMGWFKINLDTATAIIASVAIGIGIDDTIHFLNTYRHFRMRNHSMNDSIIKTLAISGKAITYTSLALIFGYSVMTVSNFKPLILSGILTGITMIATTIGALVVLPAIIKFTNVDLEGSKSKSIVWKYLYIGRYFNLKA